jgi:ElaB/YqjD/DUF883 family membrane-anchored ribosome-binding protein
MNQLNTLRSAADTAHGYADRAIDAAETALSAARTYARHGGEAVVDRSRRARDRALQASAAGGELIREHPLKTIAIGVAAVAVTLAVLSLLQHRRYR